MIADLLVEGKTGVDLEDAVRRWEDNAGRGISGRKGACKDEAGTGKEDGNEQREVAMLANEAKVHKKTISTSSAETPVTTGRIGGIQVDKDKCGGNTQLQPRAQTPDASRDGRFCIPLTAMFKRSFSAPASVNQISSPPHHDSLDSVFANVSYDIAESPQGTCLPTFNGDQTEDLAHAISADSIGCLSPLVLPSLLREGVPARWNDVSNDHISVIDIIC